MGNIIHLTGTDEAKACLEAARKAGSADDAEAYMRLHAIYMEKTNLGRVGSMRIQDPPACASENKASPGSLSSDDGTPGAA